MAVKNNRRVQMTKRLLKESLLELMQEKSIYKITIKEICDLSDMSRSTFYLHYTDQFALLEDIEKETLENTFASLNNLDGVFNTIESIQSFLNYVKSNRETFGVLLCQPENAAFQQSILTSTIQQVKESIEKTGDNPFDDYTFTFIMYGSLNVLRTWISHDFDMPTEQLAKKIFDICTNIQGI